MKRFKTGFSLAEVLLTLAIVSIIATIGFTMSRKGIEKAYNGYIYNGYNSLTIAIAEAIARGHAFNGANFGKEGKQKDDPEYGFCNAVEEVLTTTRSANSEPIVINNSYTINSNATSNGISYKFELELGENGLPKAKVLKIPQFTNNNGSLTKSGYETKKCSYILITMDVPAMKYKDSNNQFKETKSYKFMYFYETDYPLIPADEDSELFTDVSKLAYTIDDGETGRMINGTYKPRSYYSFKEAACRVYGDISYDGQDPLFGDCSGITPVLGSMLLVNPVSILH